MPMTGLFDCGETMHLVRVRVRIRVRIRVRVRVRVGVRISAGQALHKH